MATDVDGTIESHPDQGRDGDQANRGRTSDGPGLRTVRRARGLLLHTTYYISTAIMLPYCAWVFFHEYDSFTRVPVNAGILLLSVVCYLLYCSTTIRFRLRLSWKQSLIAISLFALLGIGFVGVLSAILFSYLCEAINYAKERSEGVRRIVDPNVGIGLVVTLFLIVFPLLNEMYFRGTQASLFAPNYNKQNYFFDINEEGLRGAVIPFERSATPRILFLGDSTTFGWPFRNESSYPFLVGVALQDRGFDVEVINAATIGQSIGQIRHQLPYYLGYRPDLVFLMTGIHYHRADADYRQLVERNAPRDTRPKTSA